MQANEILQPNTAMPEQGKLQFQKVKSSVEGVFAKHTGEKKETEFEPGWWKKLETATLDLGRDVLTANEMAKSKLDGDSALLRAAKGATTTLLGIGLEKALDDVFERGITGKDPIIYRPQIQFSPKIAENLKNLERTNPRIHHFVLQATKDTLTGMIYNGISFFSRPMFESVKGEHLVGSLAVNATEAMFTKGLDYPMRSSDAKEARRSLDSQSDVQVQHLRELSQKIGINIDEQRQVYIKERLRLATEKKKIKDPTNVPLEWQTWLRQYTAFSNPATLLGFDMIGTSMMTLQKNFSEVRKVRKEKGIVGRKVEMPQPHYVHAKGGASRGEPYRGNDGRWQKKESVYYGKSNAKTTQQQETEALEKFD